MLTVKEPNPVSGKLLRTAHAKRAAEGKAVARRLARHPHVENRGRTGAELRAARGAEMMVG